jgi:hypothetical protein
VQWAVPLSSWTNSITVPSEVHAVLVCWPIDAISFGSLSRDSLTVGHTKVQCDGIKSRSHFCIQDSSSSLFHERSEFLDCCAF